MDETCFSDEVLTVALRRGLRDSLPAPLRDLYRTVLVDTLRNGVPVSASALVIVLGAHGATSNEPLVFTAEHVEQLLWFAIDDFCEDRDLVVPKGCLEALHAVLATAATSSLLSSQSDQPGELFRALDGLRAS